MNKRKTILIGLDGCTFKILKPLINDGHLPTFTEILKEGCHTHLISTLPFNTLPAWTSIFTGVNPGKHGITDFIIKENGEYKTVNSSYRMVDSLWSILSRHQIRQIIINEPVTYPPEKINGIMLTGFSTPPQRRNFVYPPSIIDEVEKVSQGYEPDLPFGFEKIIAESESKGFELISRFAKKTLKITRYLMDNYDWHFLSTTITSTDRLQHFYFHEPNRLLAHYKLLDKFIKEIINLETEANILIVSDHGFGPLKKCFYINTWLKDQNLIFSKKDLLTSILTKLHLSYPKIVSKLIKIRLYNFLSKITPISTKRSIPMDDHSEPLDFNRSKFFYPSTNGGLFINRSKVNKKEIPSTIHKLSSLTLNGESPIQKIYPQNQVLWGPYAYRAADFFVIPRYGYEISPKIIPTYISTPLAFGDMRTGTHRPAGIFIAYGPDIKKNYKLKEPLFTWDITPTILHMLCLPIPAYMDGIVAKEIFKGGSKLSSTLVKSEIVAKNDKLQWRIKSLRKKLKES